MQDLIRKLPGVISTRVGGYTRAMSKNILLTNQHPCWGIEVSIRAGKDRLPATSGVLLPDPRPDDAEPAGQRPRACRIGRICISDRQKGYRGHNSDVDASGVWPGPVKTELKPVEIPWQAEPEHQDYLEKRPGGYTRHFPRAKWVLLKRKDAGDTQAEAGAAAE